MNLPNLVAESEVIQHLSGTETYEQLKCYMLEGCMRELINRVVDGIVSSNIVTPNYLRIRLQVHAVDKEK